MPIGNGGIIGPNNTPSTSSAKGVWSIREAMLAQRAGNWPVVQTSDPYFEYTTLLLPGNGTNGAQNNTFLDSSTNNFTITRNGNTTQGTFSPFSQTGWGNYFNGSSYISAADNAALDLGTGDFTIEGWVYIADGIADNAGIVSKRNASAFNAGDYRISYRTGTSKISFANDAVNERNTPVVQKNSWTHFAIVRASGTLSAYANGVRGDTVADSVNLTNGEIQTIGVNATLFFTGYMSNIRIVKGTAVYSGATYTVPTAPLTAITNTSLLTCQSNRFVDNSTNAFSISTSGSPSIQAFSPFNPTAAWSAATYGGSGYFDGSGDWITTPNVSAFDLSSSSTDFTIEAWVYNTGGGSFRGIIGARQDGQGQGWCLYIHSNNTLYMGSVIVGNSYADRQMNTTVIPPNSWAHVALVKTSSGYTGYVNGVGGTLLALTGGLQYQSTQPVIVGALGSQGELPFLGFISNVRVVKGTAVYTANFTPPTAPLTAITNTSYLLNFTNAGIYDATSKNDLETVGNAQISTTQSKFGGSSMYFDGTSDALYIPANPDFAFGTGDFTVECWVYTSETTADTFYRRIYITDGPTGNASGNFQIALVPTTGYVNLWDGTLDLIGTSNVCNGAWHHIAATRFNSTLRLFVDGIQQGSTTYSVSVSPNSGKPRPYVGTYNGTSGDFNGYINDLRITKGYARYTTNFTPPTAAFPLL